MTERATQPGKSIVKVAVSASAAAAIEWYDFFIYGIAAALVFPTLFFPADMPPFVAQIAAFGTFAVGFIARPIGGILFGHFGDLLGRKRALAAALLIMGVATTCIGLLPSYQKIGVAAPLALVVLRFAQGLAVGGQWGGAALMAIESAPSHRRGFYGSFVQMGVPVGLVLANVIFLLVGQGVSGESFLVWGWRVPFLLSFALVAIGFYVQFHLEEPGEFKRVAPASTAAASKPKGLPLTKVLTGHLPEVLLAGGAFIANNTCFYIAITWIVAYGAATLGIPKETMLGAVMTASLAMIPILVGCGAFSDRFGRRGIFMLGAVLAGLWVFAMFPLVESRSLLLITLAISVEMGLLAMMYGPQAALFAELFPVEVRYSGASLGYQIGSVFGGGFAPIIATALFAKFQSTLSIALYLCAMCAISFFSVAMLSIRARGEAQAGAPQSVKA
ncbi:MAG TPA: MFS transporter [Steroidobacter sp.]|uniref:MFS transporter n=1 Tax=Steroidobacter sp. TaxID=1978227 RepID=UPI002EDAC8D1